MTNTNLSNDLVKLVSFNIVSIKRDHERALCCNQCKVFSDNMTDCDFDTWIIAEYVQGKLDCKPPEGKAPDSKDMRVVYQVLGSWPKQDLHYEEKQLQALWGIEHAIKERPKCEALVEE